jgi:hypothetical protein
MRRWGLLKELWDNPSKQQQKENYKQEKDCSINTWS